MAKRLTDTGKWDKVWFRMLQPEYKCFWQYILDRCDPGGIWEVDFETASYFIGRSLDETELLKVFKKQIIPVDDNKRWFIIDFIEFQYKCQITDLNPGNNAHKTAIQTIKKYDIETLLSKMRDTVAPHRGAQEMYKDKDREKEKEKENVPLKRTTDVDYVAEDEVVQFFKNNHWEENAGKVFFNYYKAQDWMTGGENPRKIKDWRAKAKETMLNKRKFDWLMGEYEKQSGKNKEFYTYQEVLQIDKTFNGFKMLEKNKWVRLQN